MTFLETLVAAVQSATKINRAVESTPAVILWTDKERSWESATASVRAQMPNLLTLGNYVSSLRSGPAIWLKCAIAGSLEDVALNRLIPVVYLPGVSRTDLRAIESCPSDLQPLAELQYRGVFWSQANGKDWTIGAFLASKNGGLGLDVATDKPSLEALQRAVEAGVFLDRPISDLQTRKIDGTWLDSLLAPNAARDLLVWLNDPSAAESAWAGARWNVFKSRCKKDFGFDPKNDGALTGAEKLASATGAWETVWELYKDSYTSFPQILELLGQVQPPAVEGLFEDLKIRAGYPRANDEAEVVLRRELTAISAMSPAQSRSAIASAEKSHSDRRTWLWARMGRAPLALALEHLAVLATQSVQIPGGATPDLLAKRYEEDAWQVDSAALKALAAVQSKADTDAVSAALRAIYVPWLEELAQRFQQAVTTQGFLAPRVPGAAAKESGLCTVFVDGLRYDTAQELKTMLASVGESTLSSGWTSIPSVTASGKAWASPVATAIVGKKTDVEFQPSVAADGRPASTPNLRKLLELNGIQPLAKHEVGDPAGTAWVECGDLDHYGHEHGLRLARDMGGQLSQIVERLSELKEAGWTRFRIVTDHGWLLVPGGLPKTELSKHEAETRWGRCAVLKDSSQGTPLTFGWDWCKDVQIAMAPGISSFIAGAEYAHGGLSLQECLVPLLDVRVAASIKSHVKADFSKVVWKGLLCRIEVSSAHSDLQVDLRTKAALASSSIAAKVRKLDAGKASLAVDDDSHLGSAAFVVVLDPDGVVLQKVATTVGE